VVAVVAVAIALVIVRDVPNGRVAPRGPQASPATAPGVPEYYVAWMQADRSYLVVGDTMTGAQVSTVMSPSGVFLESVFGTAADDRTFIVTGDRPRGAGAGTQWYLLRITPGGRTPARLAPLPIPVRQAPAGVAISPDGTRLAVALPGAPANLRIYSIATGTLLRTWSAPAGQITAAKVTAGSWPFTAMVLRWSADGRTLAFAWNAEEIRALDPTAPNGSLLARSSTLAGTGTTYTPAGTSSTCNPARGWDVVADGRGIVCAATWRSSAIPVGAGAGAGASPAGAATCTSGQPVTFGFDLETPYGQGGHESQQLAPVAECPARAQPQDGAYIGWANADGSILIGSQAWNGQSRFGIFRGDRFTPLPPLPISMPLPAGTLIGADAW
jgi:hypothetical protein